MGIKYLASGAGIIVLLGISFLGGVFFQTQKDHQVKTSQPATWLDATQSIPSQDGLMVTAQGKILASDDSKLIITTSGQNQMEFPITPHKTILYLFNQGTDTMDVVQGSALPVGGQATVTFGYENAVLTLQSVVVYNDQTNGTSQK